MKKYFLLGMLFISISTFAAPSKIILLRHADKLVQASPGPALSSVGYVRALKFTHYFLKTYGEPDFVIAGKPKDENSSIRELQTIAPLVNILAERHPGKTVNILHPYPHDEYQKLAQHVLNAKKFDNKLVLICWRHNMIVPLAKALGVKKNLENWPDDDYDSVYIISYNKKGVEDFTVLHKQYPMASHPSWEELINQFSDA